MLSGGRGAVLFTSEQPNIDVGSCGRHSMGAKTTFMDFRKQLDKAKSISRALPSALRLAKHRSRAELRDPSFAGEFEHLERLLGRLDLENRYVVDIAASDGVAQSSTLPLFRHPRWSGLAVEYDAHKFAKPAFAYEDFSNVSLAKTKVTPQNVVGLLQSHGVPKDFGLLNLDIDGYDYFVLQSLLRGGFAPRVISMEINEKIPPPLFFTVLYDDAYAWNSDHFFGCSASAATSLLEPQGYVLENIVYNNAFFVAPDIAKQNNIDGLDVYQAYAQGYAQQPDRAQLFHWNRDVDVALMMTPQDAEAFFNKHFAQYRGKYELHLAP